MISFFLFLDFIESANNDTSALISEVIRRTASLNCISIVLPLSQVAIPAKKKKNLTLRIVNAIINHIQRYNLSELQTARVITDTKV